MKRRPYSGALCVCKMRWLTRETPANVQADIEHRADQAQRDRKNINQSRERGREMAQTTSAAASDARFFGSASSCVDTFPAKYNSHHRIFLGISFAAFPDRALDGTGIFCFPYPFFGSGWQENQIFSFSPPYPRGFRVGVQKCGNRLNYGCRQCRRRVWALSSIKRLWLRCQQTEAALL